MALQTIVDETDSSKTVRVIGGGLTARPRYFYYNIASATATAAIYTGAGVLHSINQGASAAGSVLSIYDGTTAAAMGSMATGIITELQLGTNRNTLIYDAIFSTGLTYRLSAVECPNVVITYSKD